MYAIRSYYACIVIPCYNHAAMMAAVLSRLQPFHLPCIVVDDGSDETSRAALETLAATHEVSFSLIRLAHNAGKGAAVIRGLEAAAAKGFTHAVQVDADGQHAIEDIPALLALSKQHPEALISGQPVYDASVPRSRLYGRWITHIVITSYSIHYTKLYELSLTSFIFFVCMGLTWTILACLFAR